MADHVWTVICNKTLIDPGTNVVSLIDITEKLILSGFDETVEQELARAKEGGGKGIIFPVRFQLVSWWTRSDFTKPETDEVRISFDSPDGQRLFEQEIEIELEATTTARRLTVNFDQLPISELGRFWFLVEKLRGKGAVKKWVLATKIPLELEGGS